MSLAAWKLAIAGTACAVLIVDHFWSRRRLATALLGVLAALALFAYFELGKFPRGYVHHWDMYHYYMGSRYFDEVGYTGLYDATVVAMLDSPDFQARPSLTRDQPVRNLSTKRIGTAAEAYERGLAVKQRFTPERWQMFHLELAFWGPEPFFWSAVLQDHGYNPSPVANRFYSLITARFDSRNPHRMLVLALVDPLLLLGCLAFICWAFGLRWMFLSAIAFGVNFASPFAWAGGAFIRQDWLFFLTAAVCLYKRGWHALAGAALAVAILERLFPALFAVGLVVRAAQELWARRRLSHRYLRAVFGAAIASVFLMAASVTTAWGASVWKQFASHIAKHADVPAMNNVGVKIAATYHVGPNSHEATREARLLGDPARPAAEVWRDHRHEVYERLRWLVRALGGLFVLGFVLAVRRTGDISAMLLGFVLVVGLLMTGAYYFTFVLLLPLLGREDQPAIPVAVLLAAAYPHLLVGADDWTFYHCSLAWSALAVALLVATWLGYARKDPIAADA